jgi:3-phenylpropionate/cinnamic acid dioxygenase small subunit
LRSRALDRFLLQSSCEEFLFAEAEMLDDNRLRDWLALLEPDITYRAPVRLTRERTAGPGFTERSWHFRDDYETLETRVLRLETEYAWAEDPPSRTRRFVGNVRAEADGDGDGDALRIKSNLLLYRGRMDTPDHQLVSAERHDVVRRHDGGLRLAERMILFDHSTLPTHNLAVLL